MVALEDAQREGSTGGWSDPPAGRAVWFIVTCGWLLSGAAAVAWVLSATRSSTGASALLAVFCLIAIALGGGGLSYALGRAQKSSRTLTIAMGGVLAILVSLVFAAGYLPGRGGNRGISFDPWPLPYAYLGGAAVATLFTAGIWAQRVLRSGPDRHRVAALAVASVALLGLLGTPLVLGVMHALDGKGRSPATAALTTTGAGSTPAGIRVETFAPGNHQIGIRLLAAPTGPFNPLAFSLAIQGQTCSAVRITINDTDEDQSWGQGEAITIGEHCDETHSPLVPGSVYPVTLDIEEERVLTDSPVMVR